MSYTLPDHTSYRLTAEDESVIRARLASYVSMGDITTHPRRGNVIDRLVRIGAHAIGCSVDDLRDSEISWIVDQATAALDR